jgi:hypothetical protein
VASQMAGSVLCLPEHSTRHEARDVFIRMMRTHMASYWTLMIQKGAAPEAALPLVNSEGDFRPLNAARRGVDPSGGQHPPMAAISAQHARHRVDVD